MDDRRESPFRRRTRGPVHRENRSLGPPRFGDPSDPAFARGPGQEGQPTEIAAGKRRLGPDAIRGHARTRAEIDKKDRDRQQVEGGIGQVSPVGSHRYLSSGKLNLVPLIRDRHGSSSGSRAGADRRRSRRKFDQISASWWIVGNFEGTTTRVATFLLEFFIPIPTIRNDLVSVRFSTEMAAEVREVPAVATTARLEFQDRRAG
jgi:hypothetical protein